MSPNTFGHTLQLQDHRLQANHQVVDPCSYRFSPVNPIDENTPKETSKRNFFLSLKVKNLGERFCFWRGRPFLYNVGVLWSICGKSCGEGKKVRTWLRWYEPQKTQCNSGPAGNNTSRGLCVFVGENSYGKRFKGLVPTSAQNMENTRWNVSRMVNPEWLHDIWNHMTRKVKSE